MDGMGGWDRWNEWIVEQFRSLGVRYVKVQEYCTVSVNLTHVYSSPLDAKYVTGGQAHSNVKDRDGQLKVII